MKPIEESVVMAMDGTDLELFHYLPYIMQDLWEIGSDPEAIISVIEKHTSNHSKLKVLDLGCGKGVVSIKLAHKLNCKCVGIDAVKEFIDEANKKAEEYNVESLCEFITGDIRLKVNEFSDMDIIILGAIGPVFGDYYHTLSIIKKSLNKNGLIILDDCYIEDNSDYTHPLIQKRELDLKQISDAEMDLIDELIIQNDEIKESNDYIFKNLEMRCNELIEKYPDKKELFLKYIQQQEDENEVLETKVVCSTMVIKKK
jgi:cyclopropane fatty-acyl-phospholipid synthase-like methyltransferase